MEGKYNYARDAFIYLLSYATLLIFTVALNFLTKSLIDRVVPDPAQIGEFLGDSMITGFLAAVIIAFPIFWYISVLANKMLTKGDMRANTGVRHWLIYLTMVVVILVIIMQLVNILMAWLGGEIGLRFVLHILVTLAIAVGVLIYQWWHLRAFGDKPLWPKSWFKIFEWKVLILVLATVVWAFVSIGSPAQQRIERFDEKRVESLRQIQWAVEAFYGTTMDPGFGRLPASLDDLALNKQYSIDDEMMTDPKTGERYEYRKLSNTTYELCATFEASGKDDVSRTEVRVPMGEFGGKMLPFEHGVGRTCFELSAALNTK